MKKKILLIALTIFAGLVLLTGCGTPTEGGGDYNDKTTYKYKVGYGEIYYYCNDYNLDAEAPYLIDAYVTQGLEWKHVDIYLIPRSGFLSTTISISENENYKGDS